MADSGEQKGSSTPATLLGVGAILLWSSTIAVSRPLTEQLGTLTAGAAIYLLAGLPAVAFLLLRREPMARALALPRSYLLLCGGLMVLYTTMLYLAIGLAPDHTQVVVVGIINYLWPSFTLVFSVPILKRRFNGWLVPGMLLAIAGIVLAGLTPQPGHEALGWRDLAAVTPGQWMPYGCALLAAVCWGLYSNLSRRLAGPYRGGAMPLFLLACGLVLLVLRLFVAEPTRLTPGVAGGLAYMAAGPALLAYVFWDLAMRRGRIILVAALSYFTPLLSTLLSCLLLGVPMGLNLWLASLLVVAGAALCKWSIREG
ncbi:MAG: Aromatic amino acid exporter YddG [Phycisphaerae bacterium]|nr:Aromatic amino acid exporter YddG [Phycisphaerae bacterium]